jgi:molecular chaperone DnaK
MARDNRSLGRFHLDGIPPAPRGIPQVEVTFDIDANGILGVTAKDKATNKEQNIRIEAAGGLSKDEIEKMKNEAAKNASEDKKRKEEIDNRNKADQLIYSTEKQLVDLGDKLPADAKEKINAAKERLSKAVKENAADISPAMEELNKVWNDASQNMYQAAGGAEGGMPNPENMSPEDMADFMKNAQGGAGTPPAGEQKKKDSDVEEADYTVVD